MADVLGKKISELAETTDLAGLYTIGSDRNNQSKKVPLQFVKEAADYANAQGDYAKGVGDTIQGNTGVNEYPAFSSSTQYAAGSVVRYNNKLYRFTALHPAGAWVGTDAIETSIKAETDVKLTELESIVDNYWWAEKDNIIDQLEFANKSFIVNTGQITGADTRLLSKVIAFNYQTLVITCPSGFKYWFLELDKLGNLLGGTGKWVTTDGAYNLREDRTYRIMIAFNNDAAISVSDLTDFVIRCQSKLSLDNFLNKATAEDVITDSSFVRGLFKRGTIYFEEPVRFDISDVIKTRICCDKLIPLNEGDMLQFDFSQYKIMLCGYDSNGKIIVTAKTIYQEHVIEKTGYYGIILAKSDDAAMANVDDVVKKFQINGKLANTQQLIENISWIGEDNLVNQMQFTNRAYIVNNGNINSAATRLLSKTIAFKNKTLTITCPSGFKYWFLELDKFDKLLGGTGKWVTADGAYNLREDRTYRIMIAFNNDAAISVSDLTDFVIRYEDRESDETGILGFNPRSEVLPKIMNLQRRFVKYGYDINTYPPCATFLYFSDIHSDNENLLRIKAFKDAYAGYISDVIQTGDLIGGSFSDGMPSAYANCTEFINTIGNHDAMNREGTPPNHQWVLVPSKDVYDSVIKPYVANWGVTQPSGADANGYCYFHKDYTSAKVRLIVVDCMHADAVQVSWFESILADAKTNGFHVVVATHYPPFNAVHDKSNPFDAIDHDLNIAGVIASAFPAAIQEFIDNGGQFVSWLCGHIHQDVMGVGVDYPKQLAISIATASVSPSGIYSEMERSNGNRTQDCFNLVAIDTTTKTLKIMRIGADYDRYMKRKNTLSWDYGKSELIYCD